MSYVINTISKTFITMYDNLENVGE